MSKFFKLTISIVISLALVMLGFFYTYQFRASAPHPPITDGQWFTPTKPMPSFTFTADNGQSFTQHNLQGHWSLLFFGYSRCQHVCPTTLGVLKQAYNNWQKQLPPNQLPQVIMISIDPARDTVDDMHQFVKSFNNSFIGLCADSSATLALQKELHVYAIIIPATDGKPADYMIKHTPELLLINPQGQIQGYFNFPEKVDTLTSDYLGIAKIDDTAGK
ncbi:MAG: SCO family protein [Legionellales bacterium]|nr:SCO family protein [Legionellales bacterium]